MQSNTKFTNSKAFPVELLPPVAGDFAKALVEQTGGAMPLSIPAPLILGAMSAAIGPKIWSRNVFGTDSAALYIMLGAGSSSGKGTAKKIVKPIGDFDLKNLQKFRNVILPMKQAELAKLEIERDGEASHDDLEELSSAIEELKKECAEPRTFIQDATSQVIVRRMSENPSEALSSWSDEARDVLKILLGKHNGGTSDEGFYCQSYSHDRYIGDRVTDNFHADIASPWLSLTWCVQPDLLWKMMGTADILSSGFYQRLLVVDTKAPVTNAPQGEIPSTIQNAWSELSTEVFKTYRLGIDSTKFVQWSEGANESIIEYSSKAVEKMNDSGPHGLKWSGNMAGKWGQNAGRIALVLHVIKNGISSHSTNLSRDTADEAIGIMSWFSERSLELVKGAVADADFEQAQRLLEIISSHGEEGGFIKKGRLKDNHNVEWDEAERLAIRFPRMLKTEKRRPSGGKGRPAHLLLSA